MANVLLHFIAGSLGGLIVFLIFARLSATSFSAPFGVLFIGIASASLAHFLSPWATPIVIVLYALANTSELLQERKTRKVLESQSLEKQE